MEEEEEAQKKEEEEEEISLTVFWCAAFFCFRAALSLPFDSSYPDPSGCFLPQSTNHILYSAVFCETLYFWLISEQETVLSVCHLGKDLRGGKAQGGFESQ